MQVTEKSKTAVRHVISITGLAQLSTRLEHDIGFSQYHSDTDFAGFRQHAIEVS